jgi:bifunctional non-homologous end joining protein LigD
MSLGKYKQKRNFKSTPEPEGIEKGGESIFVVQKHYASHLHYDFRLAIDGVLKSWAVPKGPSDDPKDKRLAVMVEDHPLEYASFEGEIPEGNYGAGKVEIWDHGTWEPITDPKIGLKQRKLEFILHGKKLKGMWVLVGFTNNEKNWLLFKKH